MHCASNRRLDAVDALRRPALALAAVLLRSGIAPAAADEVADFYKGKTATLYLGYPPGGAYDIYARLIARYLTKHMPGNPQFIVRHKPGAASLNLVNELFQRACRATAASSACSRAASRSTGCSAAKAPISIRSRSTGSAAPTTKCRSAASGTASACARPRISCRARWSSPPTRRAPNRTSIRPSSTTSSAPNSRSSPAIRASTISRWRSSAARPTPAAAGAGAPPRPRSPTGSATRRSTSRVQFATAKHPELPDVPLATDLARNDRERAALDLILTQQVMGRPFAAPPNVPPERVTALRRAFDAALEGP